MALNRRLAAALLILALVAGCAPVGLTAANPGAANPGAANPGTASLQGRWHRLDSGQPGFVADPLGSMAQPDLELRAQGLLADLLLDSGNDFTTVTGRYALVDASHLQIDGKCWQGYASHPCSQTYRFTLSGDHLTLFGDGQVVAGAVANGQLDYQRTGPAAASLPPTLVPPGPSPTP